MSMAHTLKGTLSQKVHRLSNRELARMLELDVMPQSVQLNPKDMYVGQCCLASTNTCDNFRHISPLEIEHLSTLVLGASLRLGTNIHNQGMVRIFDSKLAQKHGVKKLYVKFYWPIAHSQAEDLKLMIQSGVYNVAELQILYDQAICSICHNDIRSCDHWPGRMYKEELCAVEVKDIVRVATGFLTFESMADAA